MYDLAAQRSRAAALEAELKCLKANIGPSTVAYEAPVQPADIPPPAVATAVPMSPLRPATPVAPIDNIVVQGLPDSITQSRSPISTVYRPDTARALTRNVRAVDPQSADDCYSAGISTSQSPYHSADILTSQSPYYGVDISTSQPLYNADGMSTSPPPFFLLRWTTD